MRNMSAERCPFFFYVEIDGFLSSIYAFLHFSIPVALSEKFQVAIFNLCFPSSTIHKLSTQ